MNVIIKILLVPILAIMGVTFCLGHQIAVVSVNGETFTCQSLQEAIDNASSGSVIYLSSGRYLIDDATVITKKLCIIGIGYNAKSENSEGISLIVGNLFFNENSSGSSVMGCYLTGDVNIGYGGASVNDVVVKYCNINSIQVQNNTCDGTVVNQNYIRRPANVFRGTSFTNNIAYSVTGEFGRIINNLFFQESSVSMCYIARNIFLVGQGIDSNSTYYDNLAKGDVGDYPVNIGDLEWADLFVKYNNATISPASNFHFVEDYETQYKDYGVYGGTGFNDSGQPPLPFIQAKSIPDQTDASGNLTIKIRVNTGEQTTDY